MNKKERAENLMNYKKNLSDADYFGLKNDNGKVVIHEMQAAVIKLIYKLKHEENYSYQKIIDFLESENISTARSGENVNSNHIVAHHQYLGIRHKWSKSTISKILTKNTHIYIKYGILKKNY